MANANFTCVLDAWRSGTTLYGRMHYYRSGSSYYSDSTFPNPTMNLGGSVYTDTDFGNRVRAGIYVGDVYSTTFSRTVGGTGTRTVTWSAGSGQRSDFAGTWSADVGGFPGTTSPPTNLSFTGCTAGPDWYDIGVSVSGWGTGGSANQRYIEAQVWTKSDSGLVEPRRFQASYGTTSATIRVNNSSSGSLTITPNTEYTVGIYATNGAASAGSARVGNHVSAPPVVTISVNKVTEDSISLGWSFGNQGGKHPMIVQYSLDGANWTTMATTTGSGSKSGTYTLNNLTPNTTYNISSRVTRSENLVQANYTTAGNTVSAVTRESSAAKLLGSASGSAVKVTQLYFGNPSANRFDKSSSVVKTSGYTGSQEISTGVKTVNTRADTGAADFVIYDIGPFSDYDGKMVSISYTATPSSTNKPKVIVGLANSDYSVRIARANSDGSGSKTLRWGVWSDDPSATRMILWLYNNAGTSVTGAAGDITVDYTDLMVEISATSTPYTPYIGPQGAIPVKKLYASVNGKTKRIM